MALQAQHHPCSIADLPNRPSPQHAAAAASLDLCNNMSGALNWSSSSNLDTPLLLSSSSSFPFAGPDAISNLHLHGHSHRQSQGSNQQHPHLHRHLHQQQRQHQHQHQHQHQLQHQLHASMLPPPGTASIAPNLSDFHQQQQQNPAQKNIAAETVAVPQRQRKRRKTPLSSERRSPDLNQQVCAEALTIATNSNNIIINNINNINNCVVSTGLRLAIDDDRSTVTSSRLDIAGSIPVSTASASASGRMKLGGGIDDLSAALRHQQDELNQVIQIQIEQLRHVLLERMQSNAKQFLASVEEQLSLRIRDREVELERVNRRNMELEQRLKQVGMETHVWQSKAKSYEAMVAMLRANLNQALINQSKEQQHIRVEGYGDNEADDALSAHVDESDGAKKSRAMMLAMKETTSSAPPSADAKRYCRKCMAMEARILLVPCMHLCVCSDCQRDVEKCPICGSQRSACVEVYLS